MLTDQKQIMSYQHGSFNIPETTIKIEQQSSRIGIIKFHNFTSR